MNLASLFFSFQGRITRGQFWLGVLLSYLTVVAILLVSTFLLVVLRTDADGVGNAIILITTIMAVFWTVSLFAISVKRYHDQNRSGWWALPLLVPLGPIWVLFDCGCREGTQASNEFGPVPKGLTRKQGRLVMVGGGLSVLGSAAALMLVAITATGGLSYFHSPTDVVEKQLAPGKRIRLGGLVKEGSVSRGENLQVRFAVTDGRNTVPVAYQGLLPDLFREGQGVVTEGALDQAGLFKADSVLAKHDENYMPREVAERLKREGHWKDDAGKKNGTARRELTQ